MITEQESMWIVRNHLMMNLHYLRRDVKFHYFNLLEML
jgi:hypothetical protein